VETRVTILERDYAHLDNKISEVVEDKKKDREAITTIVTSTEVMLIQITTLQNDVRDFKNSELQRNQDIEKRLDAKIEEKAASKKQAQQMLVAIIVAIIGAAASIIAAFAK